ncbi:hypothetical protein D9M71_722150 [compost metagenome]
MLQTRITQPIAEATFCHDIESHELPLYWLKQFGDQVFGLLGRLRDNRADDVATAEDAEHGEGAQLAVTLYDSSLFNRVVEVFEYASSVQAAAGIGQFQ